MRIFKWNNDNDVYVVTASSYVLFRLSVKFIAISMSINQTALAVQGSKKETSCAKLSGINESKVATLARRQCALNFPILASVLRLKWAIALALDGSTRLNTSYLVVRVRFA